MGDLELTTVPKDLYYHEVAYVRGLEKALRLALQILEPLELPDSRAVSNEFVAMAAVLSGDVTIPVIKVIEEALHE